MDVLGKLHCGAVTCGHNWNISCGYRIYVYLPCPYICPFVLNATSFYETVHISSSSCFLLLFSCSPG